LPPSFLARGDAAKEVGQSSQSGKGRRQGARTQKKEKENKRKNQPLLRGEPGMTLPSLQERGEGTTDSYGQGEGKKKET